MENRVQEFRWKKDWSQTQLEIRSGVGKSIISRLEQDKTASTSIENAYKLAKALDTTIEELFPNEYKNRRKEWNQKNGKERLQNN